MYNVSIENPQGEILDLMNTAGYTVTKVTGMEPPNADINVSDNAMLDGGVFNSARLTTRNIVITVSLGEPTEELRLGLYRFARLKKMHRLYLSNGTRAVMAEGYAESVTVGYFDKKETVQLSYVCPDPAFHSLTTERVDFSSVASLFEFPFDIDADGIPFSTVAQESEVNVINEGELDAGVVITLRALGSASKPIILNRNTGATIALVTTMQAGDLITIDTRRGQKSVTRLRSGTTTNLLNTFDTTSEWLTLEAGDNVLYFTANSHPENIECYLTFEPLYEGM